MAWSLQAHVQFVSSGGAGGTIAFNTTGADILIGRAGYFSGPVSLSSALAGSFTGLGAAGQNSVFSRIFYLKNPTVGSDTITISAAGSFSVVELFAFSGSDTTAPFDVQNGAGGGGTSLASGAVTPTNDNELLISGITTDGAGSSFTNATFTITDQSAYSGGNAEGGAAGYVALGAGTAGVAYTPNSWSWTGSASNAGASIAAFIAASGGGGASRPVKMVGRWGGYAGASGGFAA